MTYCVKPNAIHSSLTNLGYYCQYQFVACCDFVVICYVYRVTVSVLTIAGTDCKLVELGSVASETGGQVSHCYWFVVIELGEFLIVSARCT